MRIALPDKEVVSLADRKPGSERSVASENVLIPFGYRAAISFEEQPAGIVRHLSVSVDTKGRVPSIPAVEMIAKEFGFTKLDPSTTRIWVEEFDPGHMAINVVQIAAPAQGGHG